MAVGRFCDMNLGGKATVGFSNYFYFEKRNSREVYYLLFSDVANCDLVAQAIGSPLTKPIINSVEGLLKSDYKEYFVGAIRRSKLSGAIATAGTVTNIQIILDAINAANHYKFNDEDITADSTRVEYGAVVKVFSASDSKLNYVLEQEDGEITLLNLKDSQVQLNLCAMQDVPTPKKSNAVFTESERNVVKAVSKATLTDIKFEDLERVLDMSWYKDAFGEHKDYRVVKNVEEFEAMYADMIEDALASEQLIVGLDTETTGTVIYNLSKDNPVRDSGVAISISWKDDQAYVIFTDMEYFESIDNEYCFKRFAEVFGEERGPMSVKWYRDGVEKTTTIDRDRFLLVGQNSPFDRRVSLLYNNPIWYDDDTLVMAFNINPKVVRGNVSLKNLTRRVFGHETPELSDVLGKGNEDKYRYLADEEVAKIYAGADADYTRQLWFVLKRLLGSFIYNKYHQYDVWLLNVLAVSEYNGLNTEMEGALKLADQSYHNLEILKETAYKYVGAYMDYKQQADVIINQYKAGLILEEEAEEQLASIVIDPNAKYEFEFKAADIRYVMFDVLKYPVKGRTNTGLIAVDKTTRKRLLQIKRKPDSKARKLNHDILVYGANYEEYNRLMEGSEKDKKKAKSMVLLSAESFNNLEYPMALLFEQYAVLNKEYTSYFEPIKRDNLEGKLFKSYSLARIETRRIMNPLQTIKKNLKELIIPYNDDYYMLDFDLSQIELRLMYSLSPTPALIEKMKNPEADGHTENAAMVHQKPAYLVTKKERKGAKSVSFGVPYGLGERSLMETMFGEALTKEEYDKNMFETRLTLHKWKKANAPIVEMLEEARDSALIPIELSEEKRNFMDAWQKNEETGEYLLDENGQKIPKPIGAVYSKMGFCRYFDLTNIDQSPEAKARRASGVYTPEESTIRRAAGNYPIQEYAADFFRIILKRFYYECKAEGIADKVYWHMLIHDELLCSVHKSVNPFLMYKIIKKACMITMPGHTKYFVGINVGDTWEETKDDAREAPVIFVDRMIKEYDEGKHRECQWFDHPWEFIKPLREQYVSDRIYECVKKLQPDIDDNPIRYDDIMDKFDNYTVRAYVLDYPMNSEIPSDLSGDAKSDAEYLSRFESWVIERFGEGKTLIYPDGQVCEVNKSEVVPSAVTTTDDFDDFDEDDFLEDYQEFDFETGNIVETYYDSIVEDGGDRLDDLEFDLSNYDSAKSVAALTAFKSKYENLKILNGSVIITVADEVQANYVKRMLNKGKGKRVLFKVGNKAAASWQRIDDSIDLHLVDAEISKMSKVHGNKCNVIQDRVFFTVNTEKDLQSLKVRVREHAGDDYKIFATYKGTNPIYCGSVNATTNLDYLV